MCHINTVAVRPGAAKEPKAQAGCLLSCGGVERKEIRRWELPRILGEHNGCSLKAAHVP